MDLKERLLLFISAIGLTVAEFERRVGLSNGYIKNFKGEMGVGKLDNILSTFPSLSYVWLVRGNGDMLKETETSAVASENATAVAGSNNSVNVCSSDVTARFLNLLSEKDEQIKKSQDQITKSQEQISKSQEQVSKSQEQIDRLLTMIEGDRGR